MRNNNKPSSAKLLAKIDNELKNLLANDLRMFMENNPFLMRKKQAMTPSTLSVA